MKNFLIPFLGIRRTISLLFALVISLHLVAQGEKANLKHDVSGNQISMSVAGSDQNYSQNYFKVSGKVKDKNGETVVGAYILIGSTNKKVTTNLKGEFVIDARSGDVLEVHAMSYKTKRTVVTSPVMEIVLEDDFFNLEELLVVGYGSIKKSDLTGAVATIKSEELTKQAVLSADQALQGRFPGVHVISNSGSPGGSISVNIRGIGTVNDAQPLYVVDGMPVNGISYLNMNDISSLEVLKDASASAIYGSRGANGVILITTRKGKTGESKISFNGYAGIQNMLNNSKFVDNIQWCDIQTKLNQMRSTPVDLGKAEKSINTDWLKEISGIAAIHNYYLEVSGGTDDISFSASGGYYSQDGIIKGTSMDRLTLRLNGESKIRRNLTIGFNISYSQSQRSTIDENGESWGVLSTAVRLEPTVPVRNNDGTFGSSPFVDINNPVATIFYSDEKTKSQNIVGNAYLRSDISKDLFFGTSFGVDMIINDYYRVCLLNPNHAHNFICGLTGKMFISVTFISFNSNETK